MHITGVMVYYYQVCHRKLWYFCHEISMEQESENVAIGQVIDDTSYSRSDKHINIDNVINIDFLQDKHILHEVKKSRKIEEAGILQVKYYLYYLKIRGIHNMTGKIDYPLLKSNVQVELTPEDEKMIETVLTEIEKIVEPPVPPQCRKKGICKLCAYHDLCFI